MTYLLRGSCSLGYDAVSQSNAGMRVGVDKDRGFNPNLRLSAASLFCRWQKVPFTLVAGHNKEVHESQNTLLLEVVKIWYVCRYLFMTFIQHTSVSACEHPCT
jgi:hypothetical protein